ncbi:MAG: polysaccharide pyruvyl transferase family protein [Opitutales bacterium]
MHIKKPKIALINDTSCYSDHFGCQLVGQTFREQFKRVGLDLVLTLPKTFNAEDYEHIFKKVDLICINGEGSIHHGRNLHLIELARKYPSCLVNCVFQDNPETTPLDSLLYLSARESLSSSAIRSLGVDCETVPDILFASSFLNSFPKRKPIKDIGITDCVIKDYRNFGPLKRRLKYDIYAHSTPPYKVFEKLSEFQRVATGRFHIAIACSVLEIPFSTWDSNTWKTKGLMADMKNKAHHFKTREAAVASVPEEISDSTKTFAKSAHSRIEAMFEQLRDIACAGSDRI